jgi:Spy/CpxP family protein refolding chaperone
MSTSKPSRIAALVALAFLSVSGIALAQPGPHGRGAGPGDFSMAIAALKGQLNLNTSQQAMWDSAVAASKSARDTGRANVGKVHDALSAELAKAEPDLAAVAAVADDAQTKNTALRRQVRDAWLAVYATFTPDQKALVRDSLKQRVARIDQLRQKMLEHRGGTS